jgi:membrane associated rhomboid family serine protease
MRSTWHRFLAPLTPGVRLVLAVLTVMYLAAIIGIYSRSYNLYEWLAVSGHAFWGGHVWTIVTYALLPSGIWDFLFNWILILAVGTWLERKWSRAELWTCCLIALLAAGVAKVIVQPSGLRLMAGTTPVVFGLLAAWGRLFPHDSVQLWFLWDMTVREAAILLTVIGFVVMIPCSGPVNAAIMLCGAAAGLLFVWLHTKIVRRRGSRTVVSDRMGRLEL